MVGQKAKQGLSAIIFAAMVCLCVAVMVAMPAFGGGLFTQYDSYLAIEKTWDSSVSEDSRHDVSFNVYLDTASRVSYDADSDTREQQKNSSTRVQLKGLCDALAADRVLLQQSSYDNKDEAVYQIVPDPAVAGPTVTLKADEYSGDVWRGDNIRIVPAALFDGLPFDQQLQLVNSGIVNKSDWVQDFSNDNNMDRALLLHWALMSADERADVINKATVEKVKTIFEDDSGYPTEEFSRQNAVLILSTIDKNDTADIAENASKSWLDNMAVNPIDYGFYGYAIGKELVKWDQENSSESNAGSAGDSQMSVEKTASSIWDNLDMSAKASFLHWLTENNESRYVCDIAETMGFEIPNDASAAQAWVNTLPLDRQSALLDTSVIYQDTSSETLDTALASLVNKENKNDADCESLHILFQSVFDHIDVTQLKFDVEEVDVVEYDSSYYQGLDQDPFDKATGLIVSKNSENLVGATNSLPAKEIRIKKVVSGFDDSIDDGVKNTSFPFEVTIPKKLLNAEALGEMQCFIGDAEFNDAIDDSDEDNVVIRFSLKDDEVVKIQNIPYNITEAQDGLTLTELTGSDDWPADFSFDGLSDEIGSFEQSVDESGNSLASCDITTTENGFFYVQVNNKYEKPSENGEEPGTQTGTISVTKVIENLDSLPVGIDPDFSFELRIPKEQLTVRSLDGASVVLWDHSANERNVIDGYSSWVVQDVNDVVLRFTLKANDKLLLENVPFSDPASQPEITVTELDVPVLFSYKDMAVKVQDDDPEPKAECEALDGLTGYKFKTDGNGCVSVVVTNAVDSANGTVAVNHYTFVPKTDADGAVADDASDNAKGVWTWQVVNSDTDGHHTPLSEFMKWRCDLCAKGGQE